MSTPFDASAWLIGQGGAWMLVLARVAGLSWTAPAWGTAGLGWRIRLGLALLLTVMLGPLLATSLDVPAGPLALGRSCLVEVAVGGAFGMAMSLIVAAARQGGEIVGVQAGLSPASLLDPEASGEMTPMGHLYGLVALASFLALDGPVHLVGALIESYRAVPVGDVPLTEETATLAFERVGWALGVALRAAAPVALALVLAGLALGLLARTAPAIQVMSLSLPVRAAVGVLVTLIGLATLAGLFAETWMSVLNAEFR